MKASELDFSFALAALKSGRPVRRAVWHPVHHIALGRTHSDPESDTIVMQPQGTSWLCFPADLLATDWHEV